MSGEHVDILLVEDNPADIELTRYAFEAANIPNTLYVAEDGEEAVNYIYKKGQFHDAARPQLILLDLNLPKLGGKEVLKTIKSDPKLKSIPVIILTSSQAEWDINESYSLDANVYVTKPIDIEKFLSVMESVKNFWLRTAKLPS